MLVARTAQGAMLRFLDRYLIGEPNLVGGLEGHAFGLRGSHCSYGCRPIRVLTISFCMLNRAVVHDVPTFGADSPWVLAKLAAIIRTTGTD